MPVLAFGMKFNFGHRMTFLLLALSLFCTFAGCSKSPETTPQTKPVTPLSPLQETKLMAENGVATAQFSLSLRSFFGIGMKEDQVEGVKWLRKAAEQDHLEAQNSLGLTYAQGNGVAKDWVEAVKWYRKAAEQNYAKAQYNLATSYHSKNTNGGAQKNDAEAIKWYRKAAEQNHARAQNNLATMYARGEGVAKDQVESVKWLRKAAEQDHVLAQFNLGLAYSYGGGVAKDMVEALKWLRKAAEQDHANSQYILGIMYARGKGVATNGVEAAKWFRKAAEQGDPDAQIQLGAIYGQVTNLVEMYGWLNLVANSNPKAAELRDLFDTAMTSTQILAAQKRSDELREIISDKKQSKLKALAVSQQIKNNERGIFEDTKFKAEKNDPFAQFALGLMYKDGKGEDQDYVEAVKWFRKAAEQNDAKAQYFLGGMYENGRGVDKDYVEAYGWYNLASKTDVYTANNRDELAKVMTPQQIAAAQKRTEEMQALVEAKKK